MKKDVSFEPGKGMHLMATGPAEVYTGNEKVFDPKKDTEKAGQFGRGVFALMTSPGGSVVVVGTDERLQYRATPQNFTLRCLVPEDRVEQGKALDVTLAYVGASGTVPRESILRFLADFGVSKPGSVGYAPKIRHGTPLDSYLVWRVDGEGSGLDAKVPKADLPTFVPVCVERLNENWSAFLLDRKRKWPNFRALPIRDGRAFAQLDLTEGDTDLFVGHPVTCDSLEVKLLVAWQEPGVWFVEAHNPGEKAVTFRARTTKGWGLFKFREEVELAAGSSRVWRVKGD
jgi:hypothetical protein